jgi:SAM-dependent methyltransferase
MLQFIPSLRKWVRLRRAFIQEAVQQLFAKGFRQFLDLGSGMPAEEYIHAFVPGGRIIYSDINPVAVAYGNSLFAELENVAFIQGDVREVQAILTAPAVQRQIDRRQKVAIGLNALILFLSKADNCRLAQALFEWAPPGSNLFLVFQARAGGDVPERYLRFQAMCAGAGLPVQLYTLEQNVDLLRPWRPLRIEPITEFLGLPADFITEADREGIGMSFYAAFLTK